MSESPSPSRLAIVVLAAGKGTRMKSATPKVLHAIAGRPMLGHVLDAAAALNPARVVVVTAPGMEAVTDYARAQGAECAVQNEQLGTGHAVMSAEAQLQDFDGLVLVLFGDTPLLRAETLSALIDRAHQGADLVALGFKPADPFGYGRMVVKDDRLTRIVEEKDASAEEKRITLCFAGPLVARGAVLFDLLHGIGRANAQGEYYLTDAIANAAARGLSCAAVEGPAEDMLGVNARTQLAEAEGTYQDRKRKAFMEAGVTLTDPASVFFAADTEIANDVIIGPNVVFGAGVRVYRGAEIRAFCHIEGAEIGEGAIVGPFARLRPGAVLERDVHIGNFVEVKNARIGEGAKANHLTYLGDASVGAKSNIGAGTITCNYDGFAKHKTEIGAGVFVGSNATLVAPVKIGDGAYIAAGSTLTENVEGDALALGRARQTAKPGRAKDLRARLKAAKEKKAKD
jgi:bifunctional UDP-N-acetylglucosamine pyrophosphorylase/glucosamine-1-phosphate N-acetyltransferase